MAYGKVINQTVNFLLFYYQKLYFSRF